MPYVQNRSSCKRFKPSFITAHQEIEYERLKEWREKRLKEELAKQKEKLQVQTAKGKPPLAQLQSLSTEEQRNRIFPASPLGHVVVDLTTPQSVQVKVLQSLQALKDQQEQQHNALKKMLFEIQRQVLRLQKNALNRIPHSPPNPIVLKKEISDI